MTKLAFPYISDTPGAIIGRWILGGIVSIIFSIPIFTILYLIISSGEFVGLLFFCPIALIFGLLLYSKFGCLPFIHPVAADAINAQLIVPDPTTPGKTIYLPYSKVDRLEKYGSSLYVIKYRDEQNVKQLVKFRSEDGGRGSFLPFLYDAEFNPKLRILEMDIHKAKKLAK